MNTYADYFSYIYRKEIFQLRKKSFQTSINVFVMVREDFNSNAIFYSYLQRHNSKREITQTLI